MIVAGLGLAFIDLMALVTEGRGGRFGRDRQGRLRYRASGREPVLYAGSRRGVPFWPKPAQRLAGRPPAGPEYCTAARLRAILAGSAAPQADLLACVVRELVLAYYRELFTGHPELTMCSWAAFAGRLGALALTDPAADRLIERAVPDAADRLDLSFLQPPLAGLRPGSQRALGRRMRGRLGMAVSRATAARHSAYAALLPAVVDIGEQLEAVLPDLPPRPGPGLARAVGGAARLLSFIGSGPPAHRLEQLAALSRAGVVRFLGAGLAVGHDERAGRFAARSDTLARPVLARYFVEARLPDTDIRAGSPLLAGLAGLTGSGRRLAVDPVTFQVLDRDGTPVPGLLALGAFASGGALGSFSRPGRDAALFRQNDAVARWILRECAAGQRPGPGPRGWPAAMTARM